MKKYLCKIVLLFSILICSVVTYGIYHLKYRGIQFREEFSPDRQHIVRSYQIFDTRDSFKFLSDDDFAKGYIRLYDSRGNLLEESFCSELHFLIIVWDGDHVEIQCDESIQWPLPIRA